MTLCDEAMGLEFSMISDTPFKIGTWIQGLMKTPIQGSELGATPLL